MWFKIVWASPHIFFVYDDLMMLVNSNEVNCVFMKMTRRFGQLVLGSETEW